MKTIVFAVFVIAFLSSCSSGDGGSLTSSNSSSIDTSLYSSSSISSSVSSGESARSSSSASIHSSSEILDGGMIPYEETHTSYITTTNGLSKYKSTSPNRLFLLNDAKLCKNYPDYELSYTIKGLKNLRNNEYTFTLLEISIIFPNENDYFVFTGYKSSKPMDEIFITYVNSLYELTIDGETVATIRSNVEFDDIETIVNISKEYILLNHN